MIWTPQARLLSSHSPISAMPHPWPKNVLFQASTLCSSRSPSNIFDAIQSIFSPSVRVVLAGQCRRLVRLAGGLFFLSRTPGTTLLKVLRLCSIPSLSCYRCDCGALTSIALPCSSRDTVALSYPFTSCHNQPYKLPLLSACVDPWLAVSFVSTSTAQCVAFICAVTLSNIRSDVDGSRQDGQHASVGLGASQESDMNLLCATR